MNVFLDLYVSQFGNLVNYLNIFWFIPSEPKGNCNMGSSTLNLTLGIKFYAYI